MKVPEHYVESKCCHAYQDPSNTACVRCGKPFQPEEATEQNVQATAVGEETDGENSENGGV
jgi:hypothetical protein